MKGTKILSLLLAVVLLLGLMASSTLGETATPVTVKDMKDREIMLDAPATRIVALTAADCEILYALGAGDTLVGRGEYCEYPEQVLDVPSVQSGATTNIEQILALKPQVVLMNTMAQTKDQVAALEAAGIKVAASVATDIAGVYTAIELIGAVTGRTEEANALVDSMKASFEEISKKAVGDGTKTVYFEVSPLQYGLWAAGSGTFMDELATMVGLKNAFADVQGWGEVSQEQVIERDPDYIVTISMYLGEGLNPVDEIKSRAGWQDLKAVKNGTILNADSNEISLPGPRLVNAAETLYKFVYEPETLVPAA